MFPPLDIGIGYAKLGLRAMHLPIFNIIHGDWHLIRYSIPYSKLPNKEHSFAFFIQ